MLKKAEDLARIAIRCESLNRDRRQAARDNLASFNAAFADISASGEQCAKQAALLAIDAAFALGALASEARHSADRLKRQARRELGQEGGKASIKARSKKPWHKPAEEIAGEIRREQPGLAHDNLGYEVIRRLKDREIPAPKSSRTIIRHLQKQGIVDSSRFVSDSNQFDV